MKYHGACPGGFVQGLADFVLSCQGAEAGYFDARLAEAAGDP
jgi:hypothetical protein